MDSIDDDFGALYADVELQASSAINAVSDFYHNRFLEDDDTKKKLVPVTDESTRCIDDCAAAGSSHEPEESDSDSDEDDDLNIVLNDENDDSEMLPAIRACDEEDDDGQCIRPYVLAITGNELAGEADSIRNEGRKIKKSGIQRFSNATANLGPAIPQCRTIVDVDVDSFEEKPWRNPGADVTDFFNFGFDEKGWKEYCKSLEQASEQKTISSRGPVCVCTEFYEKEQNEFGPEHAKVVEEAFEDKTQIELSSRSTDEGEKPLRSPNGRVIEVEDAMVERMPSTDTRQPRDRDSNVSMRIIMDDSAGDSSSLINEEARPLNSSLNETTEKRESYLDSHRDFHSSVGSTGEQPSEGSQEENVRTSSTEPSELKVNASSLEEIARATDMTNKEEKEVHRKPNVSDPYIFKTELSLEDQICFSPAPSYSGGKYEVTEHSESRSMRDVVFGDSFETHSQSRQIELQESHESDYKNSKSNSSKMGQSNRRKRSRHRGSSQEQRKRHCGRLHFAAYGEINAKNINDANPISSSEGGRTRYVRPKSFLRKSRTCHHRRSRFVSERDHNHNCAFPMSDAEGLYHQTYAWVDHSRRKGRLNNFGSHGKEECTDYRVRACSNGYRNERVPAEYTENAHSNYPHRMSHWSFREDVDRYNRSCGEMGYFHERTIVNNENDPDRDWYHSPFEGMSYREPRWLSSKYLSNHKGMDHRWRQEEANIQFRNRSNYDGLLDNHGDEDELLKKEYGTSLGLADRERYSFVEPCGRELPVFGREAEFSDRGDRYSYNTHLPVNRFCSKDTNDSYRKNADDRPSPSLSFRESWPEEGARCDVWTYDIKNFGVTEAYGRHRSQACKGRGRDGWMGRSGDIVDREGSLVNEDDQGQSDRRRYNLMCGSRDLTKDVMRHGYKLYTDAVLEPNRRTSPPDRISTKHRCGQYEMHIDDTEVGHYRYKTVREGDNLSPFSRNTSSHCREEQRFPRCRDSVDWFGRKSKFKRRCCSDRELEWKRRMEKMDKSFANVLGSMRYSRKGDTQKMERCIGNENRMGRFPLSKKNKDLDTEEGQIMEVPSNDNRSQIDFVAEAASQSRDVMKRASDPEYSSGNGVEIDSQRILETLAKMEKRRARFKEPINETSGPKTSLEPLVELRFDSNETKQQRPSRKRPWCVK